METRELRYFVVLAEELHFGRAAQRLGIAQPPLSRAIQRLERRLGVQLLVRTSRSVALTPAGRVLLDEGRVALERVAAAERRVRRAGSAGERLVVVLKPAGDAGLLPDVLARYQTDPDAVPAEMVLCGVGEQPALLRAGRGDVAFLHDVGDLRGLDTEELLVEGQVVLLPRAHRLAGEQTVGLADLAGERVVDLADVAAAGERGLLVDGVLVRAAGHLLELVALGRAVTVVPASIRRRLARDLIAVPVLDAPPVALHIAWPQGSTSRAVAAFVRAAVATVTEECPGVPPGDDRHIVAACRSAPPTPS